MLKEKIRKYSFWTGLSAALVMLCSSLAKCFGFTINNQIVEDVVMSICGVLVALGIVCMPKKDKTQSTEEKTQSIPEEKPQDKEE